jgi:general secretion pathway protein G
VSARARPARGFTFIELVLTLALLAVMATVALPMTQLAHQRRQEQALADALREIRQALDAYRRAVDQGRITVRAGESGFPPNLDVLVEGVVDERSATRQRIYFLRRLPRDPLATDADAEPAATWGQRSHDSPPDDPREGRDIFDVYSRAEGRGLNGVPYRQW